MTHFQARPSHKQYSAKAGWWGCAIGDVSSADDLPFDDATFASVSVRFGYMFFPDTAKATAEFARVLKPGGRICSSVWIKPELNPWTAIPMQAIGTEAVLAPLTRMDLLCLDGDC